MLTVYSRGQYRLCVHNTPCRYRVQGTDPAVPFGLSVGYGLFRFSICYRSVVSNWWGPLLLMIAHTPCATTGVVPKPNSYYDNNYIVLRSSATR